MQQQPGQQPGQPEMPTLMNHEKVLENEMVYTRTISERNQLIIVLMGSIKSQSNQIKQLEEIITKLKAEQ